jgi:hypothetical protein
METTELMAAVLTSDNLRTAWKRVKANCYLAPLWSHLDRGLMEPLESRPNGAREIAG